MASASIQKSAVMLSFDQQLTHHPYRRLLYVDAFTAAGLDAQLMLLSTQAWGPICVCEHTMFGLGSTDLAPLLTQSCKCSAIIC